MRVIGTVGSDWMMKHGVRRDVTDELLRAWRDYLEDQLSQQLGLDSDISLAAETRFSFLGTAERHTIVEVESFARKALDNFLNARTRFSY